MKLRYFIVLLALFFAFALWMGRISNGVGHWPERIDISFAVSLVALGTGAAVAALSLFGLLQRGFNGQSLDQSIPLLLSLLGGLLLYQSNWGTALALGLVATAAIVTQRWNGPKGS